MSRRASLEDVADLGFRLTGVYISPDSILNPIKWAALFYDLLPYSKVELLLALCFSSMEYLLEFCI